MALVSDKYKFMFIHAYRAGGNSMRKALGSPAVGSTLNTLKGIEVLGYHVNAKDLRQYYHDINADNIFETYYKFALVRNPFSWLVSTYKYIKYSPGHNFHDLIKGMNFEHFLHWYVFDAMKMSRPYGSNKYQTLTDFVYDVNGNLLVNFVGKMENMKNILSIIRNNTNVPIHYHDGNLPHINYTSRKLPNWRHYYTAKCHQFVVDHFAKDFDNFEYSMEI